MGIADEEGGGVIANQIPNAVLCVEFTGKTTDIALAISCAALTGNSGEANKEVRFFTWLQGFGFGVL